MYGIGKLLDPLHASRKREADRVILRDRHLVAEARISRCETDIEPVQVSTDTGVMPDQPVRLRAACELNRDFATVMYFSLFGLTLTLTALRLMYGHLALTQAVTG
jgi:hypothetical protein